jgi:hypothetical protein
MVIAVASIGVVVASIPTKSSALYFFVAFPLIVRSVKVALDHDVSKY